MAKHKKYFITFLVLYGILIGFATLSIIMIFLDLGEQKTENILSAVYLLLHIIILAATFTLVLGGIKKDSKFVYESMIDEENQKIKTKPFVLGTIVTFLGIAVCVYFSLLIFGLNLPLSFFAKGLDFALANVGVYLTITGSMFIQYPVFCKEDL